MKLILSMFGLFLLMFAFSSSVGAQERQDPIIDCVAGPQWETDLAIGFPTFYQREVLYDCGRIEVQDERSQVFYIPLVMNILWASLIATGAFYTYQRKRMPR